MVPMEQLFKVPYIDLRIHLIYSAQRPVNDSIMSSVEKREYPIDFLFAEST